MKANKLSTAIEEITTQSYTVIPDFLQPAQLQSIKAFLARINGQFLGRNNFEGDKTERIYALLTYDKVIQDIIEDSRIVSLCLVLLITTVCSPLHADIYNGDKLNIDELPLEAGTKLPELNYFETILGLWGTWQQSENVRYKAWLKTEFRNFATNKEANRYRFVDEFIFHELSMEYSDLFDGFVDITVGRFPLYYGHGLLILESSPLDAERSYGFNGIKTRLKFDGFNVDLIGIYSPDDAPPLTNNKHKKIKLLESDEEGFVAYMTNQTQAWLPKDLYYMYKHEEPRFGRGDVYFHTLGFIVEESINDALTAYWELAAQRGHRSGGVMPKAG